MSAAPAFTVARWTSCDRLDDILAMLHAAFAGLEPPSGVLGETVADLAARQRNGIVLVAEAGDEFIGSVFCAMKGDGLDLTRLAVAPARRQRGVGRALIAAAEAEARALGARRVTLRVRKNLSGNRRYFEGFGFAATGEGQDPGRPPYVSMQRVLDSRPR